MARAADQTVLKSRWSHASEDFSRAQAQSRVCWLGDYFFTWLHNSLLHSPSTAFDRTLCEVGFCRRTVLYKPKRPNFSTRLCDCCNEFGFCRGTVLRGLRCRASPARCMVSATMSVVLFDAPLFGAIRVSCLARSAHIWLKCVALVAPSLCLQGHNGLQQALSNLQRSNQHDGSAGYLIVFALRLVTDITVFPVDVDRTAWLLGPVDCRRRLCARNIMGCHHVTLPVGWLKQVPLLRDRQNLSQSAYDDDNDDDDGDERDRPRTHGRGVRQ